MNLLEVDIADLCTILGSDPEQGLSEEQAEKNRREFGANRLFESAIRSPAEFISGIFGDMMALLFVTLSLIAVMLRQDYTALLCLFLTVGGYFIFQSVAYLITRRIYHRIDRDRAMVCHVKRDGKILTIDAEQLVPGDILLLQQGDILPCDALVMSQSTLRVLETNVTGTRVAMIKKAQSEIVGEKDTKRPYFECMLFAGTIVTAGQATAFVCNTGKNVFDYRNENVRKSNKQYMPQIHLTSMFFAKQISLVWILICFFIFVVGVVLKQDIFSMFYLASALVIAAVPESVSTLSELAIAMQIDRLYKKRCILKNPAAIDRMCDVNCIIINSGKYLLLDHIVPDTYTVDEWIYNFKEDPEKARDLFTVCMMTAPPDAPNGQNSILYNGKSIEPPLAEAAASLQITRKSVLKSAFIVYRHFDTTTGISGAVVLKNERYHILSRGPINAILARCTHREIDGKTVYMNETDRLRLRDLGKTIADSSDLVIAVATREESSLPEGGVAKDYTGLVFRGFIGLYTPIRVEAAKAVNLCAKADIDVLLITDEYPETAFGLAKSVSIVQEEDHQRAVSQRDYVHMDRGLFVSDLHRYKVFSRLNSEQKQEIIRYHKDDGDIVAAVTQGLDDAFPQMESDISFVQSSEPSAAVRYTADVLMRTRSFEVIPECIRCARNIYHNIRHMLQYIFMLQFALIAVSLISILTEGKTVISPALLMIFGVVICLPTACSLIMENDPRQALKRPPGYEALNLNPINLFFIPFVCGAAIGIVTLLAYRFALMMGQDASGQLSAAVITLCLAGFLLVFSMRQDNNMFLHFAFFHTALGVSFLITFATVLLIVYLPPMHTLLGTAPLPFSVFMASLGLSLLPMFISEILKFFANRIDLSRKNAV